MKLFCYGSNNPEQLAERLGRSLPAQPCFAAGYARVFRGMSQRWGGGTASLEKARGKTTYGFCVEVTARDMTTLDGYEGVAQGVYQRSKVPIELEDGTKAQATAYTSLRENYNAPSPAYLAAVVKTISTFWKNPDGSTVTAADIPRRNPRENPVRIGKHPSLWDADNVPSTRSPRQDDTDIVVGDWRLASPEDLRRAARTGLSQSGITEDDLAEMAEYEQLALKDGRLDELLRDGMSLELAQAVAGRSIVPVGQRDSGGFGRAGPPRETLRTELESLDEEGREHRAKPFIDYIKRACAEAVKEELEEGDNFEAYQNAWQEALDSMTSGVGGPAELRKRAREVTDAAVDCADGVLDQILADPGIYELHVSDEYSVRHGTVWTQRIGAIAAYSPGTHGTLNDQLSVIVFGGEYTVGSWLAETLGRNAGDVIAYPGMSQDDLDYAVKELANDDLNIRFQTGTHRVAAGRDKGMSVANPLTFATMEGDFEFDVLQHESDVMCAVIDRKKLEAAIKATPIAVGPEHDDVVYGYTGQANSISGVEGAGFYVARLHTALDLKRESAALGHCIGDPRHGHPKALATGETQVYSLRTSAGKPKYTIELESAGKHGGQRWENVEIDGTYWFIAQVKGRANRLPGFTAAEGGGSVDTMNKPIDVRLVCEFLLALGYSEVVISEDGDMAPGVRAMEDSGVTPFAPMPKRVRKPGRDPRTPQTNPAGREGPYPVTQRVRRLLAKTRPMGSFR